MSSEALDWQKKIYLDGFGGFSPSIPADFLKLENEARRVLTPEAFAYIAGGAGRESTVASNRLGFEKYKIVPRMLRDVSVRDTSIELFGKKFSSPFFLAPIGVLELAHCDADVAVSRAASKADVPFIFSNQASRSMEQCAAVMGNSPRWFQLYWSRSRELITSFIRRAEKCGCSAIVITLDTTMLGWRTRDLDLSYLPFLEGRGIAQYTSDPIFLKMLDEPDANEEVKRKITMRSLRGLIAMVNNYPGRGFIGKLRSGRPVRAVRKFIATYSNPATTWQDLPFIRQQTKLPIILKGILDPDDASMAIDSGMDAIIVSNHGGRQVDGAIPTMEALPKIMEAVRERIPVLLDSGIRGGADAFKALALGAKAVCVGRPYAHALAVAGEQGVYELLRNYRAEFELTMALAGCKNVTEIGRRCVL